jgi:nucleoside-diphosphate-sugar epimerase
MRVFVTGGSGFVGSTLIPRLIEHGHTVTALARSVSSLRQVEALGAEGVQGDLTDAAALHAALHGCEGVIHLAAAFEMWGDTQFFYSMNVDGTDNLLRAAKENGVRRFIYMSAASVVGGGVPARMVDETYQPPQAPSDLYSKTKLIAEQHVLAANSATMTTLALRPPLIWGDGHPMTGDIREAAAHGRWMWIGGGTHLLSTVHIENLCAATLASIEHGRGGEVYYVTDGETRSVRQFLTAWMGAGGIELGAMSVPRWVAFVFAGLMARVWRALRLRSVPPITPSMVAMLGVELSMNDHKAREELGYRNVVSMDEGLSLLKTP